MRASIPVRSGKLSITVDRALAVPIYRQIYERVRHGISRGTFRAGARLPSARSLASELGVARGTTEDAYALLAAEGYIERRGPAGSIVSSSLGGAGHDLVGQTPRPPKSAEPRRPAPRPVLVALSPFQMGLPAIDAFPNKVWSRVVARQARKPLDAISAHPDPRGLASLRSAVARYLALSRGVQCSPEQVLITNGYQGAIDLVARSVLRQGDSVWFEDPGYIFARDSLLASGARIVAIEVDADGMRVADGIERAPQARLAATTPAHQSPLCVALSLSRRIALLEWAKVRDAWIVEDDYDGEFHYGARPLPALKSLDRDDRVIYAGSFSKTLFPGLRLGYLVSPEPLLEKLAGRVRLRDAGSSHFLQAVVSTFLEEGHFVRHLHRMRRLYAGRRAALAQALRETFGEDLSITVENGGMHLIAGLRDGVRDRDVAESAASHGMALHTLSAHSMLRRRRNGLLLGFTNVPEVQALAACRKLHRAIGHTLRPN